MPRYRGTYEGLTRESVARFERMAADAGVETEFERRRRRALLHSRRRKPSTGDQVSAAIGLATGHVSADNVRTVAKVAANKYSMRLKLVAICLIPILAVTFMFVANAQTTPDIANLTGAMCHTYSSDTWMITIERKKRLQEAMETLQDAKTDNPAYKGALTSYKGLSKKRFSTEMGYAEDYVEVNNTLLAFAEEHCQLNIDGLELKGLWAITQITDESGHDNNDRTKTLISVLPSKNLDITKDNVGTILNNYCILDYFSDPSMYGYGNEWGTIWWRVEYTDRQTKTGPFYTQQGPFTMQASDWSDQILAGRKSEYAKITSLTAEQTEALKTVMDSNSKRFNNQSLYDNITTWCWGGPESKNSAAIASVGDRFYMPDALDDVGQSTQKKFDKFIKWYKENNYTFDNDYEKITWIRMMHWLPNFYTAYPDLAPYWIEYVKALNTQETHAIFEEAVANGLEKWGKEGAKNIYSYDSCNAYFNLYDKAFLAKVHVSAMKHMEKKYDNFDSTLLWGSGSDNVAIEYNGKSYSLKQMEYTLPYYIFNYMMYETLYNEGDGMNDTSES